MQYSLGNMLKGGGALNPDGLALDLAFALDRSFTTDLTDAGKALITSRRGPAAKFSRGSGATQVNAAGLIEYAPENLMTRSEEFDNSIWDAATQRNLTVTANDTASPSGAIDADRLTVGSGSTVYQVIQNIPSPSGTLTSGTTYTVSAFFKPNQVTRVSIWAGNAATLPVDAMFDLTGSGSVVANAFGTASIQQYPNGWYRCVITGTAAATSSTSLRISPVSGTSRTYPGNSVDSFYAWGAQLERASTARTYYPTTSAAFYGPRFDHDPATGASKGLLIEESRTNFATWSEKVDDSSWTKNFCTINPDVTSAPNGLIVADKIVEDTSLNPHGIRKTTTVATGTAFIASIYLKAGGRNFAAIYTTGPTGRGRFLSIPADGTGAVLGNVTATDAVVTLRYITNGWYRATIEVNSGTGFSAPIEVYSAISETNSNYLGDGVSGIFVWGAQVEAGADPTSYIPTTIGTAARSADVCSITGTDFSSFYNQSEGTTLFIGSTFSTSTVRVAWQVDDGSSTNRSVYNMSGAVLVFAGTIQANMTVGVSAVGIQKSVSFAYQLNNFGASDGGATVALDTSGSVPPTQTSFRVGGDISSRVNGHIARIQYFRKRLSNAKLQTITTL